MSYATDDAAVVLREFLSNVNKIVTGEKSIVVETDSYGGNKTIRVVDTRR